MNFAPTCLKSLRNRNDAVLGLSIVRLSRHAPTFIRKQVKTLISTKLNQFSKPRQRFAIQQRTQRRRLKKFKTKVRGTFKTRKVQLSTRIKLYHVRLQPFVRTSEWDEMFDSFNVLYGQSSAWRKFLHFPEQNDNCLLIANKIRFCHKLSNIHFFSIENCTQSVIECF